MARVTSRDGTSIEYDLQGSGPAVVLVGGGLDDGAENVPLAAELAASFSVVNYARRGRGASGDTAPYAVAREVEDLEALIEVAGGRAHVVGISSGGALALEAAAAGLPIDRLAVYEVPYGVPRDAWADYVERLEAALAAGRRGEALELFMRTAGSSEEGIAAARRSELWPGLEALAPTLAYDAACLADGRAPVVDRPVLVITGGSAGFFEDAADEIVATLPQAERLTLHGQGHVADPKALAAALERFFG